MKIDNLLGVAELSAELDLEASEFQLKVEAEISKLFPYRHNERYTHETCNIRENLEDILKDTGLNLESGVSGITQMFESKLTKRELAFLIVCSQIEKQLILNHPLGKFVVDDIRRAAGDILNKDSK